MALQFLAVPGQNDSDSNLSVVGRSERRTSLPSNVLKKKKEKKSIRKISTSSCRSVNEDPSTARYYYKDRSEFLELLAMYNHKQHESFECVGDVKVGMQMCTRCRDLGKNKQYTDKYYIKKEEVAKMRTVLCHGCLGATLRKFQKKLDRK